MSSTVLAAIDLGPSSARVLNHAAGFARLWSADLRILHVTASPSPCEHQRVAEFCAQHASYAIDPAQVEIILRSGTVSNVIYREACKAGARLVVMGSRGHGRVARLFLGSTSAAVLGNAPAPVLLVPPIDLEIIDLNDRASLTCGPMLAAVDLTETCSPHLALASELAEISRQPLVFMTVAPRRLDDHEAAVMLRQRGHGLQPIRPRAVIVRRGEIAAEIAHCAVAEQSGLVVMGLRSSKRGRTGAIASAVLRTNRAFVLAVPGC